MVQKNTRSDKLIGDKSFATRDTSYSSFWLFNKEKDIKSQHFKDSFVNFYDDKKMLSEFNPTLAKNIISFWSDADDLIFDPFSGRSRALVSYAMKRVYIGCEVSFDVIDYMYKKFKEYDFINRDDFTVDIINDDCLNINKYYNDVSFDMIFTCPPYWNLERYENCVGQLSSINNYTVFLTELIKRLNIATEKLKEDKYMVLVVGDFRKNGEYITLHSDIIQKLKENESLKLHDVITVQNIPFNTAAFYFGSLKKNKITAKAHEYILVYKKQKI
jgi:DNA modification methylase